VISCHVLCHFIHCPIHFHSFPFISIHFHSFLFISVHSSTDFHYLYIFQSQTPTLLFSSLWTLVYTLVLIHVTCPSSRSFQIPSVCDQSVVAFLFQICTASHLHSCFFLVVLFHFLFRQLYSLSSSPVWDQLESAPFLQSLIPQSPLHLELAPSALLLPQLWGIAPVFGCHNLSNHKIFPCSQDLWTLEF